MVLIRTILLALLVLDLGLTSPVSAHDNHQKARVEAPTAAGEPGAAMPPSEMQQRMEAHLAGMDAQQPRTFVERLTSWFGRMHPFAVHFPIALFPVALVALILARRRGETVELIRALVIVAGASSLIASALGWLNGGLTVSDTDTVQMLHRWLGTVLGLLGGLVGWWAWRRRQSVDGGRMVAALALIVILLLVQGFLGASVTHGVEHMIF